MNLLFLGDSLIEYFDWQSRFPDHSVGNYGYAGESVQGLLARVPLIKESFKSADRVFIMSGINNIAMGDRDFIDSYRAVIREIASGYKGAVITVNSLLPVNMEFIDNDIVRQVNADLKNLVGETGVAYLNIYDRFIDTRGRVIKEYLLDDGVHISSEGYTVWSMAVEEVIGRK